MQFSSLNWNGIMFCERGCVNNLDHLIGKIYAYIYQFWFWLYETIIIILNNQMDCSITKNALL